MAASSDVGVDPCRTPDRDGSDRRSGGADRAIQGRPAPTGDMNGTERSAGGGPADAAEDGDGGRVGRRTLLLVAVVLVGIAGTGIVRRVLGEAGYNGLGRLAWVVGYGGMVLVVWYGWIRPLDIVGPD